MGEAIKKNPTYEDILKLPENIRGEIIFNELLTSPRPSPAHQKAMSKMTSRLDSGLGGNAGSSDGSDGVETWLFLTEPELHLDSHIIIPDIGAWKSKRVDPSFYSRSWVSLTPDWVCEIQSPSTARIDRVTKRRVYFELKVPYYWLLDPTARTLEAMKYSAEGWLNVGSFGGSDSINVEPFAELQLRLEDFWAF